MASRGGLLSYIVPYSAKPEMAKYNKSGTSDLPNLPYNIAATSLVDLGSSNWTEITQPNAHPSIELTSDYGIKFTKTGLYRVDAGLFIYGQSAVSGTTGCIAQIYASTTPPDNTAPNYFPSPAPAVDLSYSRFDFALANGQIFALDPDYNLVLDVQTPDYTIYFYVNCTIAGGYVVRGNTSNQPLSTIAITRIGDL